MALARLHESGLVANYYWTMFVFAIYFKVFCVVYILSSQAPFQLMTFDKFFASCTTPSQHQTFNFKRLSPWVVCGNPPRHSNSHFSQCLVNHLKIHQTDTCGNISYQLTISQANISFSPPEIDKSVSSLHVIVGTTLSLTHCLDGSL